MSTSIPGTSANCQICSRQVRWPANRNGATPRADHGVRDDGDLDAVAQFHHRERRAGTMQGSLSASYDEITWVLTSYITAAAIMTAPVGWISARFGLKRLFLLSMIGFTISSMLCGVAVHRTYAHGQEAVHHTQSVQGPQPDGRAADDVRRGHGDAGGIRAAGTMAAASGELPCGDGRAGVGATRLRHHGRDDDRRMVVEQGGRTSVDGFWYRHTGLEPLPDDRLDTGGVGNDDDRQHDTARRWSGADTSVPLQVVAFATLEPVLRTEGTALLSLLRNVGSAIGISVTSALVTRNGQIEHAALTSYITPLNRAFQGAAASLMPTTSHAAQVLNGMLTNQAEIIAYNNN